MPGRQQRANIIPGRQERANKMPGKQERANNMPGRQERANKMPGRQERVNNMPGKQERANNMPGKQERANNMPGKQERADNMPGKQERENGNCQSSPAEHTEGAPASDPSKQVQELRKLEEAQATAQKSQQHLEQLIQKNVDVQAMLAELHDLQEKATQLEGLQTRLKIESEEKRKLHRIKLLQSCQNISREQSYTTVIKALEEAKTEALEKARMLKLELAEVKEAYKEKCKERSSFERLKELQDGNELLEYRVRDLRDENVNLQNRCRKMLHQKVELESKLKKTREENSDLKLLYGADKSYDSNKSMYGPDFKEYETKCNYIDVMKAQAIVRRLKKENEQLKTSLTDQAVLVCDFQQQVEELEKQGHDNNNGYTLQCRKKLENENNQLQTRVRVMEDEKEELETKLNDMLKENADLKLRIKESSYKQHYYMTEMKTQRIRNREQTGATYEAQACVKRLENEKEQLQISLKDKLQTISDITRQLEQERKEKQGLQINVEKLADACNQKGKKNEKQHLQTSLKDLKEQLEKTQEEKESCKMQLEILENAFNEQGNINAQGLEEKNQEISSLQQQLQKEREEKQALKILPDACNQKDTKNAKQHLQTSQKDLKQQLEKAQEEKQSYKTQLEILENAYNEQVNINAQGLEGKKQTISALQQQLKTEQEEKQALKNQLTRLEDANVEANVTVKQMEKEKVDLIKQFEKAKTQNENLQTSLKDQAQANSKVKQQLEKKHAEIEKRAAEEAHMKIQKQEMEKDDFIKQLEKAKTAMANYEEMVVEKKELLLEFERLKSVHASETEGLQQQMQCLITAQRCSEEEAQLARNEIDELKNTIQGLQMTSEKQKPKKKRRRWFCLF